MGILEKLQGGDLRSIGRADEVVTDVLAKPTLFDDLFKGLSTSDPRVRMRSAEVIEKVTRRHPEFLEKYKDTILNDVAFSEQQEVIWHVAQIFPRINWTVKEREKVVGILNRYLEHQSKIVVVCAMQALADLAKQDPRLRNDTIEKIRRLTRVGSPAIRARGIKLLNRLQEVTRQDHIDIVDQEK